MNVWVVLSKPANEGFGLEVYICQIFDSEESATADAAERQKTISWRCYAVERWQVSQ